MNTLESYKIKADNYSPFLSKRLSEEPNEDKDEPTSRVPYQRDRDRIIHSRAFRRLMHKTQIFNSNYGDHYRNRLTHTLEVCQIARSIGEALFLNDVLIEAIALGHDLGHTPFGHIGERTLHKIISGEIDINGYKSTKQGFKHNFQGVQVVDNIESERFERNGMNLTLAVREGILKHTDIYIKNKSIKENVSYDDCINLEGINIDEPSFTLEGQVVAIADEIAQCTHDLEDGVRSGIIKIREIVKEELIDEVIKEKSINTNDLNSTIDIRSLIVKHLVGNLIKDVYHASKDNIEGYAKNHNNLFPQYSNSEDVYHTKIICFSNETDKKVSSLTDTIKDILISSQRISQSDQKASYIIIQLFKAYYHHPKQLPDYILNRYCRKTGIEYNRSKLDDEKLKEDNSFVRMICDHIACMTDQYAEREYKKLYIPDYM